MTHPALSAHKDCQYPAGVARLSAFRFQDAAAACPDQLPARPSENTEERSLTSTTYRITRADGFTVATRCSGSIRRSRGSLKSWDASTVWAITRPHPARMANDDK